jgi:hypothetical protein
MKDNRELIRGSNRIHHAQGSALWRFIGGVANEFECGFHVGGGERAAIGETDATAKMENVGERVGRLPGFGEAGVEIHLIVALEQATEEEAVDALGL